MKRIISSILVFVMLLSVVPSSLFAVTDIPETIDTFNWAFWDDQPDLLVKNIEAETQNVIGTGTVFYKLIGENRNFAPDAGLGVGITGGSGDQNDTESKKRILEESISSKWLSPTGPHWVSFEMAEPVTPKFYYITSANDATDRDPTSWVLEGSDSKDGPWTEVDAQTNQGTRFAAGRGLTLVYEIPEANRKPYKHYRMNSIIRAGSGNGMMQFSRFCFVENVEVQGFDGEVDYLYPQISGGVSSSWAGSRATMNGPNVVTVNGKVTGEGNTPIAAKSYTTIRSGLNIQVHPDTKLGYMFAPEGVTATIGSNTYDYKYHGAHMAVDLLFSDGTRLKNIPGVIDQYGIGMNPVAQGEGKILKTYQWNYVECEIGKYAAGKVVTEIILGFEMPDATPGHKAAGSFDDIKIFRDSRDYMQMDPADFVDIRHGANASGNATGAVIPAVARPNPFQYWVPTTQGRAESNKYAWSDTSMHGITTSKLASRHMGERLTFLFMANATTNDYTNTNVNSAVGTSDAKFTHDNEFAVHNYHYGVQFNDNDQRAPGVKLEVTPTTYGAVLRFTFPAGSAARNVLFAAPHSTSSNYSRMAETVGNTFSGWCQNGSNTNSTTSGNGALRRNYLYGEFNAQPTFYVPATTSINTLASFPDLANGPDGSTVIEMRVTTSFLSAAQAKKNFGMDLIGIDKDDDVTTWTTTEGKWFEAVKAEAKAEWNKLLNSAKVEDETANYWQLSNFYSKLARANLYPTILSEYTGKGLQGGWQYASPYRGTNANPIAMDGFMIYNEGWWDTFKSKWPLIGFLRPKAAEQLTDGIVQHYIDQNGRGTTNGEATSAMSNAHAVPRWINPGGNNMMTGTSSDAITADMYVSYDVNFDKVMEGYLAWTKSAAVVTPSAANGGRTGLHEGIFKGYHPWGTSAAAGGGGQLDTTWSLEGYINDAAQVHMLKKMAAEVDEEETIEGFSGAYWKQRWLEEAVYYEYRAKNYVNLFDAQKPANYSGVSFTPGWFMNRNRDGSFRRQSPLNWGSGFTEDNAWPYRVLVPQDGRGLANLLGSAMNLPGPEALRIALDEGFNAEGTAMDYVGGGYSTWIHEGYEKREVKLGQFGLSNQTAYHMPWMYLHSDQPWQTQYWTRIAVPRMFGGEAIGYGYMGEEDNGACASWMVWASIGLYPLDLASGQLVIGSPAFRKISITNDLGKKITINAPNNSFENVYIQSMKVNGEDYRKLYLEEDLLKNDLVIDYVMGPNPNKEWFNEAPPSLTKGDDTPTTLKDLTYENIPLIDTEIPEDQSSVVVSATNIALTGNSSAAYLFDDMSSSTSISGTSKTTYDANFTETTASVTYFNPKATKVEIYTLTSSNTADRDPKSWTLSASNDGKTWVELDKRSGETFTSRRYTRPFAISATKQGAYRYYRLDITEASGTAALRLAQIELLADMYSNFDKADLLNKINEAKAIDSSLYGPVEYQALLSEISVAEALYEKADAAGQEISNGINRLQAAISSLVLIRKAHVPFDAIGFNSASSGINAESSTPSAGSDIPVGVQISNIGGSAPGAILRYDYIDFGDGEIAFNQVRATYAGNTTDCAGAHMLVRLDAPNGPVIADISTPPTAEGTSWSVYKYGYGAIKTPVTGLHTVYIELQSDGKHVANIHQFVFEEVAAKLDVNVSTPTIVETLAANLLVSVAGDNLESYALKAYLQIGEELLYGTDVKNGTALMAIAAAPAKGQYKLIVKDASEKAEGSFNVEITEYSADIWTAKASVAAGKVTVLFNEDITHTSGSFANAVKINNVSYPTTQPDARTLEVDTGAAAVNGAKLVVSGVKYQRLFPSYSFTFTLTVEEAVVPEEIA